MSKHSTWGLLALTTALSLATGCGPYDLVNDALECEPASTEVIQDLSEVPEGFTASPQERIDALLGTFSGPQLDAEEQATERSASLEVLDPGGDVELHHFAPANPDNAPPDACGSRLVFELELTLEAEALPTFSGVVELWASEDSVGGRHQGEAGFEDALPEPEQLQAEDFDVLEPSLFVSAGSGDWWTELSWHAERADGLGEDGGPSLDQELVMMARLSPE